MTSIYGMTGWHTCETGWNELSRWRKEESKDNPHLGWKYNAYVISGYIPVVGMVRGGINIWWGINSRYAKDMGVRVYAVIHGICDILGIGILFLIPDIIVSIHRHFCQKAPDSHLATNQ